MKQACLEFIAKLPKAELHVHLEGTLDPESFLAIAHRNNIKLTFNTVEQVKSQLYTFHDLASFIEVYRQAIAVLKTEQDFYDLTLAYLKKAVDQGVVHAEIFFDLQSYTHHTVSAATIMNGVGKALAEAYETYGITTWMIMCFIRDMSEEDALQVLEIIRPYKEVIAIGLASVEAGYPPAKFERAFSKAREYGYHIVCHAGEEAGPEYIWQALHLLKAERIDHGIACMQDAQLVDYLVTHKIPLTVCPLSNVALHRFTSMNEHSIKKMYDAGLMVTINSDDPAFFNGYIDDNYKAVAKNLGFTCGQLAQCALNSIHASFINDDLKKKYIKKLDEYIMTHTCQ